MPDWVWGVGVDDVNVVVGIMIEHCAGKVSLISSVEQRAWSLDSGGESCYDDAPGAFSA